MKTINDAIRSRRQQGGKALIPFLTAGFPTAARFQRAVAAACESGADVVEIGFPHSDPLADGPVIQKSSHLSLQQGMTTATALSLIRDLSGSFAQPFVVMCYYNPILKFGLGRFVRTASLCGVKGLIVPDLIVEECSELRSHCRDAGIDLVLLVTPTTPASRIARITAAAAGFIYFVSVTGVTGARPALNGDLSRNVARIRRFTDLPVCVGFGISSPQSAAAAAGASDGAIIGSRLLQIIEADSSSKFEQLRCFLTEVRMHLGGSP